VLPGFSGAEAIAIPADHVNMVKFSSHEDEAYQKVCGHLILLGKDAPGKISARWEQHGRSVQGMIWRRTHYLTSTDVAKMKGMGKRISASHLASLAFLRYKHLLVGRRN
jgi:hypothetical protein